MTLRASLMAMFFCAFVLPCHADFTLTSGVNMDVEYNDNIYLDSEDEEDDIIATFAPNLSMDWETPRLDVSLFASLSMQKYMNNTDEDRIGPGESNQASTLSALARLYREVFFLSVSDSYARVPVNEGGRGGENNRTVNLTDSNTLTINPYMQFELMKNAQLNLGYTFTNVWYEDEDADGYNSHLYSARLTSELSQRTTMTLSGSHNEYRPKNAEKVYVENEGGTYEYDQESVSLALSFQATERLLLSGRYGHTWLDYDVKGEGDTDVWLVSFNYEITSKYRVGMVYSKSVDVSVSDGTTESNNYSADLDYDDRFNLNFRLFASDSDFVEIDQEEDTYGGQISGELPFNEKIGITGLFRYTNFDRTGFEKEQYDRYSTRFSLYHDMRHGRISAGYTYNRNESDLDDGDYDNNIVFVSASLTF